MQMKEFPARRLSAALLPVALLVAAMAVTQVGLAQQAPPGIAPVALSDSGYVFDTAEQHRLRVAVVVRGLAHPFSVALLPEGDALISERGGKLRLLRNAGGAAGRPAQLDAAPVAGLPVIAEPFRNAGLHDLALHPAVRDQTACSISRSTSPAT